MLKMNSIVFILLLSFSLSVVLGARKNSDNKNPSIKCDGETRKKANVCAEKLWFVGKGSRHYPENMQQLQKFCKQTTGLIKCVKDYTDVCGKGIQKQLANVMLYTVKMNQKSYCTKPSKKDEVISLSSCGNAIREQSNVCMENFLTGLGKANSVEAKHKVPQACCAFHELKSCIMKSGRTKGSPSCGDKELENLERYINAMAGNTLNLMCSEYDEESDKCTQLPPLPKDVKFSKPPSIIVGFGQLLTSL